MVKGTLIFFNRRMRRGQSSRVTGVTVEAI